MVSVSRLDTDWSELFLSFYFYPIFVFILAAHHLHSLYSQVLHFYNWQIWGCLDHLHLTWLVILSGLNLPSCYLFNISFPCSSLPFFLFLTIFNELSIFKLSHIISFVGLLTSYNFLVFLFYFVLVVALGFRISTFNSSQSIITWRCMISGTDNKLKQ